MKKIINKKYILYSLIILIPIIFYLFIKSNNEDIPIIIPDEYTHSEKVIEPQKEINPAALKTNLIEEIKEDNLIKIQLTVEGKIYNTSIQEGQTVFEVMKKIEEENQDFSFKYTEHKGMGSFVTTINGLEGVPGKYWIYYVNGDKPSVGVSRFVLKDSDIIKWSREGI